MNKPAAPPLEATDPMDRLGHVLIRSVTRDDLDPYFVHGHPQWNRPQDMVRACFYYAVALGDVFTVVLDNDGRGGMCEMVLHEIVAVWKTTDLLASLGLSLEDLRAGTAVVTENLLVPPPLLTDESLRESLGDIDGDLSAASLVGVLERLAARLDAHDASEVTLTQTVEAAVSPLPRDERPSKMGPVDRRPLRRLRR
jgi:hypothetical protein